MTWKQRAFSEVKKYGWILQTEYAARLEFVHPEHENGIHQWWIFTAWTDWVE